MERIITIHGTRTEDGETLPHTLTVGLDASMRWLTLYKQEFRSDPLNGLYDELNNLLPVLSNDEPVSEEFMEQMLAITLKSIESDEERTKRILSFVWAMAKNHDRRVPQSSVFYNEFNDLSIGSEIVDIAELLYLSTVSTVQSEYTTTGGTSDDEATLADITLSGLRIGLTYSDTERMTFGEWLDLITAYNNAASRPSEPRERVKIATQADMDRFTYGG